MGQSQIEAFAKAQMKSLVAKDNKERLKFTIAGCKDGSLYAHDGQDFGIFNEDAPDTVFITDEDIAVTRLTGARLQKIEQRANEFFAKYGANPTVEEDIEDTDAVDAVDDVLTDKPTETITDEEDLPVDNEALAKACKKAIKKGDFKKAKKLITKMTDDKVSSKLYKKLQKASK